jgi:hypothetical protein
VVQVLEGGVDDTAAVRLDPLERREEREVVGHLGPQKLVAFGCHCVDDDVGQVLEAIAPIRLVPVTGGSAWDDRGYLQTEVRGGER